MAEPYLGQISTFGFGFPPSGYAACNGQILSINQNTALFALLGTTFGGNGTTTFGLPNLQGAVPLMADNANYVLGHTGGEANHTLLVSEMPSHAHGLQGATSTPSQVAAPSNFPTAQSSNAYSTGAPTGTLGNGTSSQGSGQPHANQQPYLVINFCIALQGIFPTRS
jgi:microcystin-dependent protein